MEQAGIQQFETFLHQRRQGIQDARGEYAILVPLLWQENQWHLLFEVRADSLRGHLGEPCFLGGKLEPGESSDEAGLRVTEEEIGISPGQIRL